MSIHKYETHIVSVLECSCCESLVTEVCGNCSFDWAICEPCHEHFNPQDYCDHEFDPDEGYMCLNCDKNGFEDVMSAAYDRAKDIRKYGE